MPIVAGVRLSREHVLAVAALLTRARRDHTARLLLAAAMNPGQDFVALTTEDREAILDVLERPPADLAELRRALFDELNWRRRHGTPLPEPEVRWV
jgi:uncharacterized protein (DUF1778 family)